MKGLTDSGRPQCVVGVDCLLRLVRLARTPPEGRALRESTYARLISAAYSLVKEQSNGHTQTAGASAPGGKPASCRFRPAPVLSKAKRISADPL